MPSPPRFWKNWPPAGTKRLLIKTRNSTLWDHPEHKFNTDYVALSSAAAEWVVQKGIRLIGIDYLSVQLYAGVIENYDSVQKLYL